MKTQELPQHLQALEKANEKRHARAELRRSIAMGRTKVAQVVLDPPDFLITSSKSGSNGIITLVDVLTWQTGWGAGRARKLVRHLGIAPTIRIHDLSETRRRQVARRLGV